MTGFTSDKFSWEVWQGDARGYFGVGIIDGKIPGNVAALLRSAHCFGAAFVFTVGDRYHRLAMDTTAAARHVPLFHYENATDLLSHIPKGCSCIGIEISEAATEISEFQHPERAIYLLGQEDGSLPANVMAACESTVYIPTKFCLNVATAGAVVLFHRQLTRCNASD